MTSLKTLIKKANLNYVSDRITVANFPAPKKLRTGYKLFYFNRFISSEDVIKEMQEEGYEPSNVYELLSWPDWVGKDFVVALDSVCVVDGRRFVTCLGRDVAERSLDLGWLDGDWHASCRFLAVRNSSLNPSEPLSDKVSLALGHLDAIEEIIRKVKDLLK